MRKTANEKLHSCGRRELVEMPTNLSAKYPDGKLLIPMPSDVKDEIERIPFGEVREFAEIRARLAEKYGAATACALVCGISWRLVAEAAEEDRAAGALIVAPYWRVVKEHGGLNDKLPGGMERHASMLEAEGHRISRNGRAAKPRLAV